MCNTQTLARSSRVGNARESRFHQVAETFGTAPGIGGFQHLHQRFGVQFCAVGNGIAVPRGEQGKIATGGGRLEFCAQGFDSLGFERTQQGDFLRIVVPIRNIDDEPISVLAQVAFLDNQRQPLPDESNRQVILLPPGGTSNFEAISRQSRASDFVLRLSWNK